MLLVHLVLIAMAWAILPATSSAPRIWPAYRPVIAALAPSPSGPLTVWPLTRPSPKIESLPHAPPAIVRALSSMTACQKSYSVLVAWSMTTT